MTWVNMDSETELKKELGVLIHVEYRTEFPNFKSFTIPRQTIRMLMFPRTSINELPLYWENVDNMNGVYILYGLANDEKKESNGNNPTRKIYIGETTHVLQRLKNHNSRKKKSTKKTQEEIEEEEQMYSNVSTNKRGTEKDFWENTVVFTSVNNDLTIDKIKYIEAKLIDKLNVLLSEKKKREFITISKNRKFQITPHMEEPEYRDADRLISTMLTLLDCAGLDFFKEDANNGDIIDDEDIIDRILKITHSMTFEREIKKPKGVNGPLSGKLLFDADNGTCYVLKGAILASKDKTELYPKVAELKELLKRNGKFNKIDDGRVELLCNVRFTNISYAAALISGHNENGRDVWKSNEKKFREYFD